MGFYIRRFDIRYRDVERFKAGEDLALVEMNGATVKSTKTIIRRGRRLSPYRQLFRQWTLFYACGAGDNGAWPVATLGGRAGCSNRRQRHLLAYVVGSSNHPSASLRLKRTFCPARRAWAYSGDNRLRFDLGLKAARRIARWTPREVHHHQGESSARFRRTGSHIEAKQLRIQPQALTKEHRKNLFRRVRGARSDCRLRARSPSHGRVDALLAVAAPSGLLPALSPAGDKAHCQRYPPPQERPRQLPRHVNWTRSPRPTTGPNRTRDSLVRISAMNATIPFHNRNNAFDRQLLVISAKRGQTSGQVRWRATVGASNRAVVAHKSVDV